MSTSKRTGLDRFLAPKSIAVVGASDRPGSLGLRTMRNLESFRGQIFPVSHRLKTICGHRCYSSIEDLPDPPDCAVLSVPAAAVEHEVEACARRGAGGCVVFASGYAEIGTAEGLAAQERLAVIARESGMRLLGPNTTGFANFDAGAHAGFAEFPGGVPEGRNGIGLVSQSGALGLALAQSAMHGTSISHVLTCGNSADIDVADLVLFLCGQATAGAIALIFEGLHEPQRLIDAVQKATQAGKPVVLCRVGTSTIGAASVRWHTGTRPHEQYSWDEQLAEAGATVVRRPETLIETATFLKKSVGITRPGAAPRIAILSSSGGSGILAADSAEAAGLPLATFHPSTRERLARELPYFASPRNPCDATTQATADPPMITRCANVLLSDPSVDCLVLPWGKAWDSGQFGELSNVAQSHGKPICLVWMSQWLEGPGAAEVEATGRLSLFRSIESCMSTLSAWECMRDPKVAIMQD